MAQIIFSKALNKTTHHEKVYIVSCPHASWQFPGGALVTYQLPNWAPPLSKEHWKGQVQADQVQEVFMGNVYSANLVRRRRGKYHLRRYSLHRSCTTVNKVCSSGRRPSCLPPNHHAGKSGYRRCRRHGEYESVPYCLKPAMAMVIARRRTDERHGQRRADRRLQPGCHGRLRRQYRQGIQHFP